MTDRARLMIGLPILACLYTALLWTALGEQPARLSVAALSWEGIWRHDPPE